MKYVLSVLVPMLVFATSALPEEQQSDADTGDGELGAYTQLRLDKVGHLVGSISRGTVQKMSDGVEIALLSEDPEAEPLPLAADTVTLTYSDEDSSMPEVILLEGDALIKHPEATVRSERAEWDFKGGLLVFTGNPTMDSARLKGLQCEKIVLDFEKDTFEAFQGKADVVDITTAKEEGPGPVDRLLLKAADVKDWTGFLTAIRNQCLAEGPSPGKHIRALIDPDSEIELATTSVETLLSGKDDLLKGLNRALQSSQFYDPRSWQGATLSDEANALIDAKANGEWTPAELVRFNRLVLTAAYPQYVVPPPAENGSQSGNGV